MRTENSISHLGSKMSGELTELRMNLVKKLCVNVDRKDLGLARKSIGASLANKTRFRLLVGADGRYSPKPANFTMSVGNPCPIFDRVVGLE